MKFQELGLDPQLVKAVEELGYVEPTDIQKATIPLIKKGVDVFGQSSTGSGKTAAFGLPILEKVSRKGRIQVLVLVPIRELCEQVAKEFQKFAKYKQVKILAVYGGVGIESQIRQLRDADIVIGTPGRTLDHLNRRTLDLRNVSFFVLDEADKMFEMGFVDDIKNIARHLPAQRQTLMFSATISSDVMFVAKNYMKNPQKIETETYLERAQLNQTYYNVIRNDKFSLLVHLIKEVKPKLAIVFCATRDRVSLVAKNLSTQGINALAIHGGFTQGKRNQVMDSVKAGKINILVATDVAARGLDIKNVTHVFNYDIPKTSKEYIHRIGRTARAGETGKAISLLAQEDHDNFRKVLSDREIEINVAETPQFQRIRFETAVVERFSRPRRFGSHNQGHRRWH